MAGAGVVARVDPIGLRVRDYRGEMRKKRGEKSGF